MHDLFCNKAMGVPMTSVNGVFMEELGRVTIKMQKTLESKVILLGIWETAGEVLR
jgi:hypothetical protein